MCTALTHIVMGPLEIEHYIVIVSSIPNQFGIDLHAHIWTHVALTYIGASLIKIGPYCVCVPVKVIQI